MRKRSNENVGEAATPDISRRKALTKLGLALTASYDYQHVPVERHAASLGVRSRF